MDISYYFYQRHDDAQYVLGQGDTNCVRGLINRVDSINRGNRWMKNSEVSEAVLELKPKMSCWGKSHISKSEFYKDKSRVVTKSLLQNLATFLQSQGYEVSIDQNGEAPILTVIKFQISQCNELINSMRSFSQ